jgi:Flp pilus assembly protein TadD
MIGRNLAIGLTPFSLVGALALALVGGCTTLPNDVLRQQASDDLRDGDIAGADKCLTQAVDQEPTDAWAQYMMGRVRLLQGRPVEAETFFEQALVNESGTLSEPAILDGLAQSLLDQGNKSRLVTFLAERAHEHPTVAGYLRQGKYLGKMGDADGAVLAFKKAARIAAKTDATPYLAAAEYYDSIGDTQDRDLALRRAYTADHYSTPVLVALHLAGMEPGPQLLLPPED